jgi:gluconate kinase
MEARKGHYMPVSLLSSQLNTQEEPTPDEQDVIQVDANGDREVVMDSTFKIVQARIRKLQKI